MSYLGYSNSAHKKALFIAFHFPPIQGSTGVIRTLSFVNYLINYGWTPAVMSVLPFVYEKKNENNSSLLRKEVRLFRSIAFDAKTHFSFFKKYPDFLGLPDRWQSWIFFAFFDYFIRVKKWKPNVVISTYPIASAHWIGFFIHRLTGVPWVVDLRDPMTQDGFPQDKLVYKSHLKLENKIFKHASLVIFTTQGTRSLYKQKYPMYPENRLLVISNGYDEDIFPKYVSTGGLRDTSVLKILHSGSLHLEERNPYYFFKALSDLIKNNELSFKVEVIFRAAENHSVYEKMVNELDLMDTVYFLPPLSYIEAASELTSTDLLLLLQGDASKFQIPAKTYEYFYARKPILALTDPSSDTGILLNDLGYTCIANINDKDSIKSKIIQCINSIDDEYKSLPPREKISKYSRRELTRKLANELDALIHK